MIDQVIQLSKSTWTESHNAHKSSQKYPGLDIISKKEKKEKQPESNPARAHSYNLREQKHEDALSKEVKPPEK